MDCLGLSSAASEYVGWTGWMNNLVMFLVLCSAPPMQSHRKKLWRIVIGLPKLYAHSLCGLLLSRSFFCSFWQFLIRLGWRKENKVNIK